MPKASKSSSSTKRTVPYRRGPESAEEDSPAAAGPSTLPSVPQNARAVIQNLAPSEDESDPSSETENPDMVVIKRDLKQVKDTLVTLVETINRLVTITNELTAAAKNQRGGDRQIAVPNVIPQPLRSNTTLTLTSPGRSTGIQNAPAANEPPLFYPGLDRF